MSDHCKVCEKKKQEQPKWVWGLAQSSAFGGAFLMGAIYGVTASWTALTRYMQPSQTQVSMIALGAIIGAFMWFAGIVITAQVTKIVPRKK